MEHDKILLKDPTVSKFVTKKMVELTDLSDCQLAKIYKV